MPTPPSTPRGPECTADVTSQVWTGLESAAAPANTAFSCEISIFGIVGSPLSDEFIDCMQAHPDSPCLSDLPTGYCDRFALPRLPGSSTLQQWQGSAEVGRGVGP